jgi:hypothetical protein
MSTKLTDPFSYASQGDRLPHSAKLHNAQIEALRRSQSQQFQVPGKPIADAQRSGIVRIKNTTANALPRFSILQVSGAAWTPTTNLVTFQNDRPLSGTSPSLLDSGGVPTTFGRTPFVVTLQAVQPGAMVLAMLTGVVAVQVNVATAGDYPFADRATDHTDYLVARHSGQARILYRDGTSGGVLATGTKWAIVDLLGSMARRREWVKISDVTTFTPGTGASAEILWQKSNGDFVDSGKTITVYTPPNTAPTPGPIYGQATADEQSGLMVMDWVMPQIVKFGSGTAAASGYSNPLLISTDYDWLAINNGRGSTSAFTIVTGECGGLGPD